MRTIFYSLFAVLSIAFFSCTGGNQSKQATGSTENNIQFDSIKTQKEYHLFSDSSKPKCELNIEFTFPTSGPDQQVLKKMQSLFISKSFGDNFAHLSPQEAVPAYQKAYIESYQEFEKESYSSSFEMPAEELFSSPSFNFYEFTKNTIYFNQSGILCNHVFTENYTGGAHGSHKETAYSIFTATGQIITEKDLFCDDCLNQITELILATLVKENGVNQAKDLENIGFFEVESISPNGNFLINDKGITYLFNEYEIAPYVMGAIKVFLPYKSLAPYLHPSSPVRQFLQ